MGKPKRRLFGVRQIILTILVLGLGGGGGVAAYYLSDMDPKDIIAMLDVTDPSSSKLTWLLPGSLSSSSDKAQSALGAVLGASGLLVPPGGAPVIPPPEKPLPGQALPGKPESSAPHTGGADTHAGAKPNASSSLVDSKMLADLVVPPKTVTARPVPPPVPRSVELTPSFSDLSVRSPDKPLAPAPEKALLGSSAQGPIPVVSADGRQVWKVYGRPLDASSAGASAGNPRIAVIVRGLGLDSAATDAAITRLPADVSLAFSPYALDLPKWIKKAREAGHEALVVLPVAADAASAADSGKDPGPLGLNEAYSDKQNIALLQMTLARAPGVVGVLTPQTSFLAGTKGAAVLADLLQRGLLYVGQVPHGMRLPPLAPITDVVDAQGWRSAIDVHLEQAQDRAKSQPAQVLVASPRPVTFQALASWLDGLAGQGMVAAPVSALAAPPSGK